MSLKGQFYILINYNMNFKPDICGEPDVSKDIEFHIESYPTENMMKWTDVWRVCTSKYTREKLKRFMATVSLEEINQFTNDI